MTVRRRRILILLAIVLVAWASVVAMRAVFSRIDYDRVLRGAKPVFAWESAACSDGGTVVYQGLGYELTALCRFRVEGAQPTGYDRGPVLVYQMNWLLLPQSGRSEVRFEPR